MRELKRRERVPGSKQDSTGKHSENPFLFREVSFVNHGFTKRTSPLLVSTRMYLPTLQAFEKPDTDISVRVGHSRPRGHDICLVIDGAWRM